MSAAQIFKLPDLGEGLTESEVLNWKIKVGQRVELNQVIAEVETAKAVVELPSPYAGVVQQLHAEAGEIVPVGSPLVTFADKPAHEAPEDQAASVQRTPTLVGYGAEPATGKRPARRPRHGMIARPEAQSAVNKPALSGARTQDPQVVSAMRSTVPRSTPPVRKLARDQQIDLASLQGSGPDGLIVRADVEAAMGSGILGARSQTTTGSTGSVETSEEDRVVKLSAVRRATAKAMVESAFTAPHASEFLTVDVTASLELLDQLRAHPSMRGLHVNMTTYLALVVTRALQHHRALNSSWDGANDQIIEHGSVNLGMAVSTDRGLLVPVLQGANKMSLGQLAQELSNIIEQGRAGTLKPKQLSSGTFSITNVGVFGIDAGTPILPPGQAAILAVGQIKRRPWEYQDEVALRHTATLALSFDHRLIDGKEGSEFLADVGRTLENPGMLSLFV